MSAVLSGVASIDAVLRLARHLPVFPCRAKPETLIVNGKPRLYKAKSPLVAEGLYAATQDEATIRQWWREHPDALVGVPMGVKTGLVAIDYDPGKRTEATDEWVQAHSEILMSARVHTTMRGGMHWLFRLSDSSHYATGADLQLAGTKRPGIDLRADGGYIIWWPLHGGTVNGSDTAPFLPAGLIDERRTDREKREIKPFVEATPESWQRERKRVMDALAFISPDDYDGWLSTGMALHAGSGGSDDGFQLWHAWSAGEITGQMPTNYGGIDDCRYRWSGFDARGGVGLGSLFHAAKAGGYAPAPAPMLTPPAGPPPIEDGYMESLAAAAGLEVPRETAEDGKPPAAAVAAVPPRILIPWESFEGNEPPSREWIIEGWIPAKRDTLLAGRGGVGKTLLAQCMCTALAIGGDYVDEVNQPRRSLLWAGEDDTEELWRRQNNINAAYNVKMAQIAPNFHAIDYSNADITLAATAFGTLCPTALIEELRQQVNDWKIDVVWLDNVARIYGGNENDRHQVTQFMAWLRAAIAPAALVLLSHPAKVAGSEYSGSTAWEGAVRARLFLSDKHPDAKPDAEEEETVDDALRYLSKRKANYSENDVRRMTLKHGVLIPDPTPERGRPRGVSSEMVKDTIRRAIRVLAERDIFAVQGQRGDNYLPRLMQQYKMLDRVSVGQVAACMREMIMAGELVSAPVGKHPNRTPKMGLKLV